MSSQSRDSNNTTTNAIATHCNYNDDGLISSNSCLTSQTTSAIATSSSTTATTTSKHLHKIITPTDPLAPQDYSATNMSRSSSNTQVQKRSAAHISSSTKNFLSDIFADDETTSTTDDVPQERMAAATNTKPCYTGFPPRDNMSDTEQHEESPLSKKARTSSFSRCPKSFALANGATLHEVSSPSVVVSPSPRNNKSVINVQELQDIAFPSLPEMQAGISTATTASHPSISHLNLNLLTEMDVRETSTAPWETRIVITDGPSYGWFVSTDNDTTDTSEDESSSDTKMFLPDTKPEDLFTLKAITAPSLNQEVEVQKALAADTIDDVLGDIF